MTARGWSRGNPHRPRRRSASRLLAPAGGLPAAAVLGVLLLAGSGRSALAGTKAGLPSDCSQSGSTVTCSFSYTGAEQAFAVPKGITHLRVTAVGAAGFNNAPQGGGTGGAGGTASATISVTPQSDLYVEVGGTGGDGGWNGGAGLGGGASDVRTCSTLSDACSTLGSRLVVAGGGGAGGMGGDGGAAGSPGKAGQNDGACTGGQGGGAGGATAGGAGGLPGTPVFGTAGGSGTFGQGGAGPSRLGTPFTGGGGGGYYGGGGGGAGGAEPYVPGGCGAFWGGGGGGSSYAPGGTTGVAAVDTPPSVTISYRVPAPSSSCPEIVQQLEKLNGANAKLTRGRKRKLKGEARRSCPVIKGTVAVGKTLHATPGRWSGDPASFAYHWLRCNKGGKRCLPIRAATSRKYTAAKADERHTLRVRVTAGNGNLSSEAESLPTRVVPVPG